MNRESLVSVLDVVGHAAAAKAAAPAFESVFFDGKQATAYDSELAITATCALPVKGGVQANVLRTWASGCAGTTVEVEVEGTNATFKCGRSRITLPLLKPEQLTSILPPELVEATKQTLQLQDPGLMRDALTRCMKFAGSDPAHPQRAGVTLVAGNRIRLWATDDLTMTRQILDGTGKLVVVLPNRWLQATEKIGAISVIEAGDGWVRSKCSAEIGPVVVFSRCSDENAVDDFKRTFEEVVGEEKGHPLVPKVLEAAAHVARTAKALGGEWCELMVKDGLLVISALGTKGKVRQSVKVSHPDARAVVVASELLRVLDGADRWAVSSVAVVAWGDRTVNLVSASDS